MKVEFKISLDTESGSFDVINLGTGEVKTTSLPKKTKSSTKALKDDNPIPQITLEENKYQFNAAAVKLMGIQPDDKMVIKTEKQGKLMIPVIGTNESFGIKAGNRVTKSFTVSCRGKANDELKLYGTIFTLEEHPEKEGIFIMKGNETPESVEEESTEVQIDDDVDINLDDLVDEVKDETVELTALDLDLND